MSLGVPETFLGTAAWSMWVDVSVTEHSVMYTTENVMCQWSPFGELWHSLKPFTVPGGFGHPTDIVNSV